MFKDEKEFKNIVNKLNIDTKPNAEHKESLRREMLSAFSQTQKQKTGIARPDIWRIIVGSRVGYLAAAFLIILSLAACFVLSQKNANLKNELELAQQDIAPTPIDDSVTINFYFKEHHDFIAQQASLNSAASLPIRLQINQDDLMYYEFLGVDPEFLSPGIIVRGPSSQQEIDSSVSPVISDGNVLTLSEASQTADFDIISPSWFHPGYLFDQIMRISGSDAMHLLYTNSINSVSLFEQPLDGQNGLSHQDFREYAVYNMEEDKGTILAWRDDTLSYVLIGNVEISLLMDMAQSINATK